MQRRKRAYHHGDLRRALTDAALELVAERGASGFTLREAARRAGVSHTAPYNHFPSREALLAALAEEGFMGLGAALRSVGPGEPLRRLRDMGIAYVRFAVENAAHVRVMFGAALPDRSAFPALVEAARTAFAPLLDSICDCQRAGAIRSGDPIELALAAWSLVHGLSSLIADGQLEPWSDRSPEALARTIGQLLFEGLTPR
jgi:AcrR family transcriptional regulator